jgi:membrane-bound lytic murein transglycosylase B
MRGAWAGEFGQTQFLPSSYEQYALDFDDNHRADLIGSSADALASTAHYVEGHGWAPHEELEPESGNLQALGEWNASEKYRRTIVTYAKKLRGK